MRGVAQRGGRKGFWGGVVGVGWWGWGGDARVGGANRMGVMGWGGWLGGGLEVADRDGCGGCSAAGIGNLGEFSDCGAVAMDFWGRLGKADRA